MKKLLLIVFAACLVLGCDKTPLTLEMKAKNQFADYVKQNSNVTSSDSRIIYKTDSVCIFHFTLTNNNGMTDSIEYIYYVESDSLVYDTYFSLLEKESIHADKGKSNLDYESTIKQRILTQINESGRVIGKQNLSKERNPLMRTGNWTLHYFVDEFNEKTNDKYLYLQGSGTFSNTATTNSELTAGIYVTEESIYLKLLEYNKYIVKDKDTYYFYIKDSDGEVTKNIPFMNNESGNMYLVGEKPKMKGILEKEGKIVLSGRNYYSEYVFSFNLDGYKEAIKFLK